VVDLEAQILAVVDAVDIVLWPVAMDFKRADVEAMPDQSIAVAFINGGIRMSEQEEWVHMLRRKAQLVVAFGACAHMGGVVGLGNMSEREEILDAAYRAQPSISNRDAVLPGHLVRAAGHDLSLPTLLSATLPLEGVVPVDYTIPGCPPSPAVIAAAVDRILSGDLPAPGAVLAPNAALCETCPRKDSKPEKIEVGSLRRLATSAIDPEACFLAQGLVCLGPGTRQGCQPGCVEAGMPCRGCFGPLDGVRDGGAAMLSAFASLLAGGEDDVRSLAAALPDPAGTFWRYSFAAGLVPRRPRKEGP
jgi:F420-non-reducing hydrogenase small subunit